MNREDIATFHEFSVNVANRLIYLGSHTSSEVGEAGVDNMMAEAAIKNFLILDSVSHDPIKVILNSPGGDVYHGFAIYDAIKRCRSPVTVIGTGYVMSMGSIILQAGSIRQLSSNAKVLLHYGNMSLDGNTKDLINWVESEKLELKKVEDIYLSRIREKNPRFSRAALQNKIRHDCLLDAKDAVKLGLADCLEDVEL